MGLPWGYQTKAIVMTSGKFKTLILVILAII